MHLLAATPGQVDDGEEPVDLGQTPANVVFISAADTELAALSAARAEMTAAERLGLFLAESFGVTLTPGAGDAVAQ